MAIKFSLPSRLNSNKKNSKSLNLGSLSINQSFNYYIALFQTIAPPPNLDFQKQTKLDLKPVATRHLLKLYLLFGIPPGIEVSQWYQGP